MRRIPFPASNDNVGDHHHLANELSAMKRLHDLSSLANRTLELPLFLEKIVGAAIELQNAACGSVHLYEGDTKSLHLFAQRGFDLALCEELDRISTAGGAIAARALAQHAQLVAGGEVNDRPVELRDARSRLSLRCMQATPLYASSGAPLAVLSTYFREPRTFEDHELRLTELYAREAAVEIERQRAAAALRESEQRLRLTIESVTDYAIFTMDIDGHIDSWNIGAQRLFGYSDHEVMGRPGEIVFTPEDRAAGVPAEEMRLAREHERANDERWHLRMDGTRFYVSGVLAPLRRGATLTGYVKIARDLTEQQRAQEALRSAHDELERRVAERTSELSSANRSLRQEIVQHRRTDAARRDLLRHLVNAQEQERARISRELHDQLGQQVSAIGLKLSLLKQRDTVDAHLRSELEKLADVARQLDIDIDFLVGQVRPRALDDLGLVDALSDYVETWSSHFGVTARVHAQDFVAERLEPETETVVYRIAQEALTNIAKHARARNVHVVLQSKGEAIVMVVRDDGVGFQGGSLLPGSLQGFGMDGMRERAVLAGGTLSVRSERHRGTTVLLWLPAQAAARA
jgi:PAS domain S-box-containing protein